jgi:hypothetical protein
MWVGGFKDTLSKLVGMAVMSILTRAHGSLIRKWILQVTFAKLFRRTFDFDFAGGS